MSRPTYRVRVWVPVYRYGNPVTIGWWLRFGMMVDWLSAEARIEDPFRAEQWRCRGTPYEGMFQPWLI